MHKHKNTCKLETRVRLHNLPPLNESDNTIPMGVIFDMDGVLADTEPLHAKTYVQAFCQAGLCIDEEQYRQAITLGGSSVRNLFKSLGGKDEQWPEVARAKAIGFKEMLDRHGKLMPGVTELLVSLRRNGLSIALATSAGRNTLSIVMDRFDLWQCFDVFVTWQDVEAEKPDPEAFILAARRLQVEPEDCVVIEDSPRGVLAAHRAGMKCIAVPTPSTADGDFSYADLLVGSLELVDLSVIRKVLHRV